MSLNDIRLQMGWYPKPELFMAELMKEADQDKISSAIAEQVALVGSQSLYERINSNFKELKFEAFLAKVGNTWDWAGHGSLVFTEKLET